MRPASCAARSSGCRPEMYLRESPLAHANGALARLRGQGRRRRDRPARRDAPADERAQRSHGPRRRRGGSRRHRPPRPSRWRRGRRTTSRMCSSPARASCARRRAMSAAIASATRTWRPARTPGPRRMSRSSAGSPSMPPSRSARTSAMSAWRSDSTRRTPLSSAVRRAASRTRSIPRSWSSRPGFPDAGVKHEGARSRDGSTCARIAPRLPLHVGQRVAHRIARNAEYAAVGLIHVRDHGDGDGDRQGGESDDDDGQRIGRGGEAEAREQDDEPEGQDAVERRRNGLRRGLRSPPNAISTGPRTDAGNHSRIR